MATPGIAQASPLMMQYFEIKSRFPDAFVFFQVGDFYELFFDDAMQVSRILGITLTRRGTYNGNDIPLSGVPLHTASHYYLKLVSQGYKVVLCDQTETAQPGKLVHRAVSQVITPGTVVHEQALDEKRSSLLMFISVHGQILNFAVVEFLTQQITFSSIACTALWKSVFVTELEKLLPREVLRDDSLEREVIELLEEHGYTSSYCSHCSSEKEAQVVLEKHQLDGKYLQLVSLITGYMNYYYPDTVEHFSYSIQDPRGCMWIDASSQKHLELITNTYDGSYEGTLYHLLDNTVTAMGSRMIRHWITHPLKESRDIEARYEAIAAVLDQWQQVVLLQNVLKTMGDLERVIGRVRLKKALYVDYQRILRALYALSDFKEHIKFLNEHSSLFAQWFLVLTEYDSLKTLLETYISLEPLLDDRLVIKEADEELVRLDLCIKSSAQILLNYEREQQEKTGIASLKVRQTPLYGYVVEINKSTAPSLSEEYIRVQTLTNKERYTHQELKTIEYEIVHAQEAYKKRDHQLFMMVTDAVYSHASSLLQTARVLARYDALISLACVAQRYNYVRPTLDASSSRCTIINGKHPVLLACLGSHFVPNSLTFDSSLKTWIITGPNMGGKSTFMRQSALICLMAHIGSFVPAEKADIPLLDSLFTRIGASDYVVKGKSTFYVEMEETALICALSHEKSFVILDEIGRGTSTYDGMSLAYAIIQHIHREKKPFMLCATHYHELRDLFKDESGIEWHYAAVSRQPKTGEVIMLHIIKKGVMNESMGIEVARRVGLPDSLIAAAEHTKQLLEGVSLIPAQNARGHFANDDDAYKASCSHQILADLKQLNMDELSPRQAYEVLEKLSLQAKVD